MQLSFPNQKGKGFKHLLPSTLSSGCVDILSRMLVYDETERWSASGLLKHKWFEDVHGTASNVSHFGLDSSFDNLDLSLSMSEPCVAETNRDESTGGRGVVHSILSNKFDLSSYTGNT